MKKLIPLLLFAIIFSCNKKNDTTPIDREEYDKAYKYYKSNKKDSAFKYFNRAKDNFIREENFSFAGNCLVYMAIIQCDEGDYYGSQETSLSAFQYLNLDTDSSEISSNNNNLGIVFQNLKNYDRAAIFYNRAAKFSQNSKDSLTHLNNKAVALSYSKKFDSAISIFNRILASPKLKDSVVYSKVYDNKAYTRFLQNRKYNAEKELIEALKIRKRINDTLGLIASYSHLAEYFENRDTRKALFYSKEMLRVASKLNVPDDRLDALKKIIFLDSPDIIKLVFKTHQHLNDSLQTERNKSKSQFAFERFGSERLQKENAEKENNLLWQYILAGILFSIIIIIIVIYRKRQVRLQKEKELEVKNTQLRLSKKVHDVVANGIYQVMTKIENQEHFDRNTALDELEFVYEKSRDISYDKADEDPDKKDFSEKISELVASFKNENTNTYIAGNESEIWNNVSQATQHEVYQVIRELLVNMRKHSQADRVVLRFERENNRINIFYTDNGVGISDELVYKNGLQNTVSRIAAIAGSIIFDTKTEKGLKVHLSFPVS